MSGGSCIITTGRSPLIRLFGGVNDESTEWLFSKAFGCTSYDDAVGCKRLDLHEIMKALAEEFEKE